MAIRLATILLLLCSQISAQDKACTVLSDNDLWAQEVKLIVADSLNDHSLSWRLQQAGFWLFEIDSSTLKTGPKLELGTFKINNSESLPSGLSLNDSNILKLLKVELEKLENEGYPFAQLEMQSYLIRDNRLDASLKLNRGPLIQFDSLVLLSYDGTNRKFIEREIAWKKGRNYSTRFLKELDQNLRRLEFVQIERAPAVAFFPEKARVYLYLKKRNANLINGVVGLNTDDEGNSTLTGDFQLRLLNTFKRGELIDLQWRSPGNEAQDLRIALAYPYLWNTPLGIQMDVELLRQDSSFLRRDFKIGFPYRLAPGSNFRLSMQYFSSSPLGFERASELEVEEVSSLRFNLGFDIDRRNNPIVATKGYSLDMELGSGQRQSPEGESQQYLWKAKANYFLPIRSRWVWHQELQSAGMTGAELRDNEVFRLGGLNSLRGFNEWSFFTPAYALMRSEIRYMLGPYDYLSIFGDLAFNEVDRELNSPWDQHSGLGAGLNFQTKGGIFSLFLAVGQSNQSTYDFRSGKIHLAYVNRF